MEVTEHEGTAQAGRRVQVVILEDRPIDHAGMETLIDRGGDMEVVASTGDPSTLLAFVKRRPPDAAVIDLRIYGDDSTGIRAIESMKTACPGIKFVVLSRYIKPWSFVECIRVGAHAIVHKEAQRSPGVVELIRMVMRGCVYYDPDLVEALLAYVQMARLEYDSKGQVANPLSHREQEVLALVRQGLSNKEIGACLHISSNGVKSHVTNAMNKLGVNRRHVAASIADAKGWLPYFDVAPAAGPHTPGRQPPGPQRR